MEYNKLPGTNIEVSKICLGTMTWGRQNSETEAFEQMDYSLDQGVNFFDTAELYPVPATPERYADTERIIGNWIRTYLHRIWSSSICPKFICSYSKTPRCRQIRMVLLTCTNSNNWSYMAYNSFCY